MMKDYPRAIEDLERAAALDPGDPAVYYKLGLVYLKTGQVGPSSKNFKKAADLGMEEALKFLPGAQ
ncbi:MAG: hypothetical protein BMS9Abin23_0603 [Thermodesulfobacteriota bacterium]|nr:MAG: hypothetical protein BMS9Abin23_0603 [Thermodesulfobacteriota bacterium]